MEGIVGQAALEQVLNVAKPTRTPAYHQFILHRINLRDLLIMVVIDNSAAPVMIMTVASLLSFNCQRLFSWVAYSSIN